MLAKLDSNKNVYSCVKIPLFYRLKDTEKNRFFKGKTLVAKHKNLFLTENTMENPFLKGKTTGKLIFDSKIIENRNLV